MDLSTILMAVVLLGTTVGSWFQGRKGGLNEALGTASDVVGMLATQVGELRLQLEAKAHELEVKDAQIEYLQDALARCREAGEREGA